MVVEDAGNGLDYFYSDIKYLRDELYYNVQEFQVMMQPLVECTIVYSTTKADKMPQECGFYLIDHVLEMDATGMYSMFKRAE